MELFLWLYFYDHRWFFNIKISVNLYKTIWMLQICLHLILIATSGYYMQISQNFNCSDSIRIWLYHRTLFSFLITFNIILFILKIRKIYEKEYIHMIKASIIYPILKHKVLDHDYWVRRNSVFSTPGILLFLQGLISFFWSYATRIYYQNHYDENCDTNIQLVLDFHSIFIYYGNVFVFIVVWLTCMIKVSCYLTSSFFPKFYVHTMNLIPSSKSNLIMYFNESFYKYKKDESIRKSIQIR